MLNLIKILLFNLIEINFIIVFALLLFHVLSITPFTSLKKSTAKYKEFREIICKLSKETPEKIKVCCSL